MESKLYTIVAHISEKFQVESERFDRCDFTKQIAIIPCSAKTGLGIPELLTVLTGLTQKYLENTLKCTIEDNAPAKGTILEVKQAEGMGTCVDAIIYDGVIRSGDTLIIGGLEKPILTKVKGLFEPKTISDMRDKKTKFQSIKQVPAATGVRISANDIEHAIAGMPLISLPSSTAKEDISRFEADIQKEIDEVVVEIDKEGIVVKADTLGSLEALIKLLKDRNIPIRKASIGNITKKDLTDAESNYEKDPLDSIILGFNVESESKNEKVKIITSTIIYKLIEEYESWKKDETSKIAQRELEGITRPGKIEYLHYTFRASNPAVIGIEVTAGSLKSGNTIMKSDSTILAQVKEIQKDKKSVTSITKKDQAAISLPGITAGRQISEGDIFYTSIPEADFRKLKSLAKYLDKDEVLVMKEIAEIMRKNNPVWGV